MQEVQSETIRHFPFYWSSQQYYFTANVHSVDLESVPSDAPGKIDERPWGGGGGGHADTLPS